MRSRIAIYRETATADGFGQAIKTPALVGTYWAFVRPLTGRELAVARQQRADVSHRIEMRRVGEIEATMYAVFRGRRLNFLDVIDVDNRRRELQIDCTEPAATDA